MTLLNVLATPLCFVPDLLEGEDNYDVLFRLVTSYTAIHGVPLQYVVGAHSNERPQHIFFCGEISKIISIPL